MQQSDILILVGSVIVIAACLCAGLIRMIRPVLMRYAMARPNVRSSHVAPTPQGAGIAVIASTLLVAGITVAFTGTASSASIWTLVGATIVLAAIGAADDLRPIAVTPRLLLQAICVAAVLYAIPAELRIVPILPVWVERSILLLAGLWFVNLVNFMDGLDWMTVAEVIPISGALVVIGVSGELSSAATVIAAALGGAMTGFAPFNRPVAKVFLGDVGSLPIGLILAWCFLDLADHGHLVAAILLPLYYLADATVTLLRRAAKQEAIWLAHRSHYYQRATDNGFRVLDVVTNVFVLNIALAGMAGLSVWLRSATAGIVLVMAGAAAVTLVLWRFSTSRL